MALSPMMKQYMSIKEEHKDCLLFYRLGDFYEMFFDDALTASRELDLTLTGRDCGLEERAPMCGVPHHSAESYIARLIEKGYKVAICEQTTTPEESKGLVERAVVRVVTAGTVMESSMLDDSKNNYIAAVYYRDDKLGIAWSDITTGEFCVAQYEQSIMYAVAGALYKLQPSEIMCNNEFLTAVQNEPLFASISLPKLAPFENIGFDEASGLISGLIEDPQTLSVRELAFLAGGALMRYITQTQKRSLAHITSIKDTTSDVVLVVDPIARKNLELTETLKERKKKGSLLGVLDKTQTSMGSRLLRKWLESPLGNKALIELRLDSVDELVSVPLLRETMTSALKGINDIERIAGKIAYGSVMPRDCLALAESLSRAKQLKPVLMNCGSPVLKGFFDGFDSLDDVSELLVNSISENPPAVMKDGGFIKVGFHEELDKLRNAGTDGKQLLAALEMEEKESTGIKNLKIGFNKIFGYYIEVSKTQIPLVPYRYQRKQTVANGERYITAELKKIEDMILGSEERAIKLEQRLFAEIKSELDKHIVRLQKLSEVIAICDTINSLAIVAVENNYCKPKITKDDAINIVEGRHPVVERFSKGSDFVPNDAKLDCQDNCVLVITGPNMAGKSTYMRQVALIVIMAHMGSFVPAKSASICLVDRVFTRIGASDDLSSGQSTFMVEMSEMANILTNSTKKSLLILDEIGRGTSTLDGLSIAWSVMEHVASTLKVKTLFATHYHELSQLEGVVEGVKNYRVAVRELNNTVAFLHKIVRGGANKSFGIEVAALAGMPKATIDRAKAVLGELERQESGVVANTVTSSTQSVLSNKSETDRIIEDVDLDKLTPLKALELLADLQSRMKKDA